MGTDRRAAGGLVALAALVCLAWAVSAGPLAAARPADGGSTSAAGAAGAAGTGVTGAEGKVLYDSSCAACHGPQGEGTINGPALTSAGAAGADFMLRTGRMPLPAPGAPSVPRRPAYDDAQIRALVAYVASLGAGPAIPTVQVTDGSDLASGRRLYIASCAACHGAAGSGDAVGGGYIAPPVLDTAPTQVGEAIRIGPGAMPVFDAKQISDRDLSSIAAYLALLRRDAAPGGLTVGGVGPVAEGYVAWLAYLGGLLVAARLIERGRRR